MTDPESRDFRMIEPAFSRPDSIAPAVAARRAAVALEPAAHPKIFASDGIDGQDALGIDNLVSLLAELSTHKNVELPFCIGILGGPGSGKSFALKRLEASAAAIAARAGAQNDTVSLSQVAVVRADAAHLDGGPMPALAAAICAGLGQTMPDLVEESLRAIQDPHAAADLAAERLDVARKRLHQERDNLAEVEGRRARLFEALLYENPGSQVDAYVRTHRPRIANRLQAFGIAGDPVLNYKDFVASLAATHGRSGRIMTALRTLWAFKGQSRLLVIALILAVIGAGLEWTVAHQALWLAQLRSSNDTLASVAAWFEAHMGTIAWLGKAAFVGAGLAVLINLWRAFRFLQPILRGVTLLRADLDNRQHELDSAVAHQTRRVDSLAAEVERAARVHAEADRLASKSAPDNVSRHLSSPFHGNNENKQALRFVAALAALMEQNPPRGTKRILFMLDNLDAVPPARACEILDAAHRLLANKTFVTVIAVDPRRLSEAGANINAHIEKWVQIPVQIDATVQDHAAFITHLVGQSGNAELTSAAKVPATAAPHLDQALSEEEAWLLTQLAPLAGRSARSLKRFVNLYRLTRPLLPGHWACLAFMLALESGGTQGEIEAMANALAVAKSSADLDLSQAHPRLAAMLSMVRNIEREPLAEAAKRVAPIAATFSFRS